MSVYLLVEVKVEDASAYERYLAQIPEVLRQHGGRYVFQSAAIVSASGAPPPDAVNLMQFDSRSQLGAFLQSPGYAALAELRASVTTSRSLLVEGTLLPD